MKTCIDIEKLSVILEYCFSLHEADELSYMLTDETKTREDILNYLNEIKD